MADSTQNTIVLHLRIDNETVDFYQRMAEDHGLDLQQEVWNMISDGMHGRLVKAIVVGDGLISNGDLISALHIRINTEMHDWIRNASKLNRLDISEFMRQLLLDFRFGKIIRIMSNQAPTELPHGDSQSLGTSNTNLLLPPVQ